ncbi:MAG: hypothetical protein DSY90_07115 [Deltaproteobacteria bacterium]|nr:MAG: hypothetical protein DSY90_07115 [Deltaproteobacteria bacterium]
MVLLKNYEKNCGGFMSKLKDNKITNYLSIPASLHLGLPTSEPSSLPTSQLPGLPASQPSSLPAL